MAICAKLPKMPRILPPPRLTVNVLLFDAFSNMLLACLLEPLRVVRDETRAELTWTIFSHDDAPVLSSSGLRIAPDMPRAEARACDILIVIGGDEFRADAQKPSLRRTLRLTKRAKTVIAADTGTWLLAAAGYLDGRKATLHWQLLVEFAELFPNVTVVPDRHVRDGQFLTCGGASTALDLILAEISARFGRSVKFDVASMFLHDLARPAMPWHHAEGMSSGLPATIHRCMAIMASRLEHPATLDEIAREAGLTLRTMARLFDDHVGMPPGRYYQHLRLSRARDLVTHTPLPIGQVALRCGFASASALSSAFSRRYGFRLRSVRRRPRTDMGAPS